MVKITSLVTRTVNIYVGNRVVLLDPKASMHLQDDDLGHIKNARLIKNKILSVASIIETQAKKTRTKKKAAKKKTVKAAKKKTTKKKY